MTFVKGGWVGEGGGVRANGFGVSVRFGERSRTNSPRKENGLFGRRSGRSFGGVRCGMRSDCFGLAVIVRGGSICIAEHICIAVGFDAWSLFLP